MRHLALLVVLTVALGTTSLAQNPQNAPPSPSRVEISPATADVEIGQTLKFTVTAYDASGAKLDQKPSAWFAGPFDVAAADENGAVTFFHPGEVRVGAIVGGKSGVAVVAVKPQRAERLELASPRVKVSVGSSLTVGVTALTHSGEPLRNATVSWSSSAPGTATVDDSGFMVAIAPGTTTLKATSGTASATVDVDVVRTTVSAIAIEPRSGRARTGDVVHFAVKASRAGGASTDTSDIRWSVSGTGATIWPDGAFVADEPGSYIVTASIGDRSAAASVLIAPRNVARRLEVVGRTPVEEFQSTEQWIVGKYAYLASFMAGRLWVYDISNPAAPVKVDSVAFDARLLNDVSTTADGKITVVSREAASNRKNGIVFLDTSDPAHPKILSEYTETVSGGVHSAFISGHYVYLTDDATGSLRVIDFRDAKAPKEVARWQVESEFAREISTPEGPEIGGRYLHDVQVVDGLLYAGYWRDGLVILDVGNGIKGGSPEKPAFVSQLRMNYHELYGPGWLAGAHAVFRYKQYVFVGDEVLPAQFDLVSRDVIPVKGMVHVVDVSDIAHPKKVATYQVPEGGSHNMWVENDIMYMGYYNAGARVVDVSGELRGDLYRQGREIARLWTGDPKGYRANAPFCWGAQPHDGLVYFNDLNSGIWIARLADGSASPKGTR